MKWQDSWEVIKPIDGGAQGDCFLVMNKNDLDKVYFLKQLKDGGSSERRSRFFQETTIHKAFTIKKTTEIVETNAEEFKNKDLPLYYVAKYIEGQRLDKYIQSQELSEEAVKDIFIQLLKILAHCHAVGVVHRDIKPENIIIDNNYVYLVDFGIASSHLRESDTKVGQEVGNRFLRLPEFSAGSTSKRDTRSDITLACGVALYLFSKTYPRVTQNGDGLYPHQTEKSTKALEGTTYKIIWNTIFDRAFLSNLSSRWSSCEDVLEILDKMNVKDKTKIELLKSQLESYSKRYNAE